jgi:hypothetical protein
MSSEYDPYVLTDVKAVKQISSYMLYWMVLLLRSLLIQM